MGWGYHSLLMMGQSGKGEGILVLLLKNYRRLLQYLKNGHINGVLNSQLTKQR